MMDVVASVEEIIGLPEGIRVISWLPSAHVAERNAHHYIPIVFAGTITCCENPREVMSYLPDVRPNWFFAVPRIWEKLKAGLETMLQSQPDEQREKVERAIAAAREKVRLEQAGEEVPADLAEEVAAADEEYFAGLRKMLGLDDVITINVGAAPTPIDVLEFFHAIGLELAELYGMSESTGAGTCNRPGNVKIGTVGPGGAGMRGQAGRRRRGADPRRLRDGGLPQPAREDRRDDRRGRLAAHRRHRRDRRRRLPQDRRPQEGADHQRGRQEHVAGQHRGRAQDGHAR